MSKKEEERRERFKRLGTYRTNQVLKSLRVLGNCANTMAYEYTDKEIDKIFKALQDEMIHTKCLFKAKKAKFTF
jgi:hypothetical protein